MSNLAQHSDWPVVSFGDVVTHIKDRVQDVMACGLQEYIRGEHFEPANLRLIGRSTLGDGKHGSAFCMRFRPRDVLYVSRNPQLRKAAIADFEGICANTTYVCRAKEEYLLQDLLPFIMQTESFVEYTIRHKRGSTNFYLNWSDIAGYEFALPPLEEQRRISEVLQAAQELKERLRFAREALSDVSSSWIESSLASNEWPESVATDVLDRATVGIVIKPAALYVPEGTGIPALRSLNITPHRIVMSDCVNISHEGHRDQKKSRLQPGDLAIVRSGRPGDAVVIPDGLGELNCIDLIIATPGEHLRSEFLCAVLNSRYGRRQFASGIAGTAQKHFNVGLFKKLKIPVPSLVTQDGFIAHMHQLQRATTSLEDRQKVQGDVARSLLEEVMSI